MTKIVQFSTIGALMAGHLQGEKSFSKLCCGYDFGLGCSDNIGGELTICEGIAYEATAGKSLHQLDFEAQLPFMQLTNFKPQEEYVIKNITHQNAEECLRQFIQPDNIFIAVSVKGLFEQLTIRRPRPATQDNQDVEEFAEKQKIDHHQQITGQLIGFWTPELFGRISVPGFHFHFLDDHKKISGHVLEFSADQATISFEEKPTLEVTNPQSQSYKEMNIDVKMLDKLIQKVEK